jgi:phosphohistidine phosphatase
MKLILIRHGQAVERDEFASQKKDDSLRPLVIKGRQRTEEMAKRLSAWVPECDILVTSPYLRAKQSAVIVKKHVKAAKFVEAVELIPSAPPLAFVEWLRLNAGLLKTVVAVGHEPQLNIFATWALAGHEQSFVKIKKSGILALEVESFQHISPTSVELRYLIQPNLF